ncbi:hypothetical protein JZ751_015475 [Albula glossodonta]|uniref:Uncharacterized protein n=1 Tax=Albula glossodonta TaxID=121402 RepID=A0A8T2MJV4_9TELE|nr:hypothetical protein JZ751_015475 [Albula glossodonta]
MPRGNFKSGRDDLSTNGPRKSMEVITRQRSRRTHCNDWLTGLTMRSPLLILSLLANELTEDGVETG